MMSPCTNRLPLVLPMWTSPVIYRSFGSPVVPWSQSPTCVVVMSVMLPSGDTVIHALAHGADTARSKKLLNAGDMISLGADRC